MRSSWSPPGHHLAAPSAGLLPTAGSPLAPMFLPGGEAPGGSGMHDETLAGELPAAAHEDGNGSSDGTGEVRRGQKRKAEEDDKEERRKQREREAGEC